VATGSKIDTVEGAGKRRAPRKRSSQVAARGKPQKAAQARARKATPKGPGRPTLLTEATTDAICQTLRVGNYLEASVRNAGLNPSTVYAWLARGRREQQRLEVIEADGHAATPEPSERPFVEFLEAVTRAQAEAETFAVVTLRSAMSATRTASDGSGQEPDWNVRERAATHYLERRHRAGWSRGEAVDQRVVAEVREELVISADQQRERTAAILLEVEAIGLEATALALMDKGVGDAQG
jgi:hypothetical protein